MKGYEFIRADVQLPPVDCPLVIEVPAGTRILHPPLPGTEVEQFVLCLVPEMLRVERRSYLQIKDRDMEYWLADGGRVVGRFNWSYP